MKFEYKIIEIGSSTSTTTPIATFIATAEVLLSAQGEEGWQLVSIDSGLAYLMRIIRV